MNDEYAAFEFATIAIRVLLVIAAVAVFSYAMKSRLMFLAGLCGSFLGYVIPYSTGNRVSGNMNGIVFSHVEWKNEHVLGYGLFGAILACGIVVAIQIYRKAKVQYSIGTILMVNMAIAIAVVTWQMGIWWPKD